MTEGDRYLLDTTALIDFSKGFEPTRSKILELIDAEDEVAVCSVTVSEFFAGLSPQDREQWRSFLAALTYWDVNAEAAEQAGIWRYELARRGIQLSTTDALIAATARQYQATLVTNDAKAFPMSEVQVLSPRG